VAFENDRVSFRWRDYAHDGKKKVMTVSADEFLHRFLLHVLPKGLVRIRHFGFFANRRRQFALGIEALERFVRKEPLRLTHECVFGVLALESEPIDPRL
jgi:hypothetical protein